MQKKKMMFHNSKISRQKYKKTRLEELQSRSIKIDSKNITKNQYPATDLGHLLYRHAKLILLFFAMKL